MKPTKGLDRYILCVCRSANVELRHNPIVPLRSQSEDSPTQTCQKYVVTVQNFSSACAVPPTSMQVSLYSRAVKLCAALQRGCKEGRRGRSVTLVHAASYSLFPARSTDMDPFRVLPVI